MPATNTSHWAAKFMTNTVIIITNLRKTSAAKPMPSCIGAFGSPQYDNLDRPLSPERGLLAIRKDLNLCANLRPAVLYPELANASTLKPEIVANLDILIVRELTGDIYFGELRGIRVPKTANAKRYNTMKYSESEIRCIAHVAFNPPKTQQKVCSVGKANVLETTELWRRNF